jgi:hypothetical protein
MDRLSVLSGGITGPRKGIRRTWEPRRRKKGGEYATGERDAFPQLGACLGNSEFCWREEGESDSKFSFMFGEFFFVLGSRAPF